MRSRPEDSLTRRYFGGLCGPHAIARATGLDWRQVAARVVRYREIQGETRTHTKGSSVRELQWACERLGWRLRPVFRFRRVRLAALVRRITRGRWLFQQNRHWFGVGSGTHLRQCARRSPNAVVIAGWLLTPTRRHR